jgi:hypothetical protein
MMASTRMIPVRPRNFNLSEFIDALTVSRVRWKNRYLAATT